MRYYLGLDNGGTNTKAAIFDTCGREIGKASVETHAIVPRPGFVERDMEEMWRANCAVVRGVLEKTGVDPAGIAAIAVCGHGKGLYLWGKNNAPARNGVISTDTRAYTYTNRWKADGTAQKAFALTCQNVMPCQPVALLAWLRDNEPQVYDNIQWVFECKDYVRFRLTGKAMAEYTDYSGANLLNLHTRAYDPRLLDLFGIPEVQAALPPLCAATEVCGTVTAQAAQDCGLLPGTPVAGGMFDIDACAMAVNVVDEQNICMIAGTWSINEYLSRQLKAADGIMNSLFAIPDYYLVEECSPTSAGNNEWAVNTLLPEMQAREGENFYPVLDGWVESVSPGEFCPIFLPFVLASNVHPNARGSFVGISNFHTRKHLFRSIFEGIVFSHKYHLERLLASRGAAPGCIRLAGGVTKSKVWVQMFADILELPVETMDVKETGAAGCAIAAAVAVGDYPGLPEAAKAMCRVKARVEPNPETAPIYRKKYSVYTKTVNALDGLWDDMQALVESSGTPG